MKVVLFVFCLGLLVAGESIDCSSNGLTVWCDLSFDEAPNSLLTVEWRNVNGGPLVAQDFEIDSENIQIKLFRFAPFQEYLVQCVHRSTVIMKTTVETGGTGISELDTNPFATIDGDPTYELIFLDIGNAYTAIDSTGWVVWFFTTNGTLPMEPAQAKSQLPNNDFVFLDNGVIIQVHPDGTVAKRGECPCDPYTQSYYNHECRATKDGTRVYSIQQNVQNYTVSWSNATSFIGQYINYWSPEYNNYTNLYNSFDIWDIYTDYSRASKGKLNVFCLGDSNGQFISPTDWTHCNSVSEGQNDNILISSRSLSSILSARKDGSGIEWMVSVEIESDYTFPNSSDKFYNQHDVQELKNGNIILIDNGADRPVQEGKYSRAAEYVIDHDAKTVSLIWEFIPTFADGTNLSCFHGGSVVFIGDNEDSEIRFLSFPCDSPDSSGSKCSIAAYEVDADGNQLAFMEFNNIVQSGEKYIGSYRAEPWKTINGERAV